jgi:hypothetical protein
LLRGRPMVSPPFKCLMGRARTVPRKSYEKWVSRISNEKWVSRILQNR